MSTEKKVVIGYWDCRGMVQPIRLILEYTDTPYEFRPVASGPAPYYSKEPWLAKKFDLLEEYDFPNLPYYSDDKVSYVCFMLAPFGRVMRETYLCIPIFYSF